MHASFVTQAAALSEVGAVQVQKQAPLGVTVVAQPLQSQPQPVRAGAPPTVERFEAAGLAPTGDAVSRTQTLSLGSTRTMSSSQAAPVATPPPAATCDTAQSKLYCVYTVQAGDTLSGIAVKFDMKSNEDVASWELLVHSNRPDVVSEGDLLQIGQKLRIPTSSAVLHTVLNAQTLSEIADQYDVSSKDITGLTANGIGNADILRVGQEILVPNPARFASAAPAPPPVSASGPASAGVISGGASRSGFMWPASGPLSSRFGAGHPLGIDIDLYGSPNGPIVASAAGTVTFAGGNTCCSYGLYVIVDHGNGYQTLYAHLSRISVSVGQKASRGQVLGAGGRTGYATGNHLHFEVRRDGSVINPTSVLP